MVGQEAQLVNSPWVPSCMRTNKEALHSFIGCACGSALSHPDILMQFKT